MLNIKNQVFITLKIDGSPIEYVNIKELTLAEGNGAYAPTMKLELQDPTSLLSRTFALSDANTVEVLVARSLNDTSAKPRRYRIFGPTRNNPATNPNVTIIGILDAPKYFTASSRESYTGTTTSVISQVASKSGLTYVGPDQGRQTNDKQTWLDVCTTRARFVHEVTRHGYMDDKSCMASVVTSFHELRYKNLIDTINTPPDQIKYVFSHNAIKSASDSGRTLYLIKEARDKSSSGLMSNWKNYGNTRQCNRILGVPKTKKTSDVKVPHTDSYIVVNEDVSSEVGRARVEYAQIDCSNTHEKYQDAVYQNLKGLGVFSEVMSLLVDVVTDIQLFDPLIYRQADADPTAKVRNEDIYILVGKTIVVRGGIHYAERLQCARLSISMKGKASLKSTLDEGGGADSSVGSFGGPNSIITQPTIGSTSHSLGIGNIPTIGSINSTLNAIRGINGSLVGLNGNIVNTAGGAVSALSQLMSAVGGGNTQEVQSALGKASQAMAMVMNQMTQVQNATSSAPNLINTLSRSVSGMPTPVANSVMTGKDGPSEVLANMALNTLMYGKAGLLASAIQAAIPSQYRALPEYGTLYGNTSAVNGARANTGSTLSPMWNTLLSAMHGTPVPSNLTQYNTSFMDRLANLMLTPGMTQDKLLAFVHSELMRLQNGTPTWMPPNGMTPQPTLDSIESDTNFLNTTISNMGSMYA